MKNSLLTLLLFSSFSLKAQLSVYYQQGETKTIFSLANQNASKYITQFSYFNFAFVEQRLNNSLEKETDFLAFTSGSFTKIDSFEVFERKYKRIQNTEIIPSKEILFVRYFTRKIDNEQYISKVEISGNEGMIFNVYKQFWKPTIDLKETKNGKVAGHRFWNDSIELIASTFPNTKSLSYLLKIFSSQIEDFHQFEVNYLAFIKEKEIQQKQFEARKLKTYTYKELSLTKYEELNNEIDKCVQTAVSEDRRNSFQEKYRIILKIDSLGKRTFSIAGIGNELLAKKIMGKLNQMEVEVLREKGVPLKTMDEFSYEINVSHLKGTVKRNKNGLKADFDETEEFMDIVNRNAIFFNRGLGRYDISIQTMIVNNVELNDLSINEFYSRVKAGNTFKTLVFTGLIGFMGYLIYVKE